MQADSIELTVIAAHGCSLRGFPAVSVTAPGERALSAGFGDPRVPTHPRPVSLRPGQNAYFGIGVERGCLPRAPTSYDGVAIRLPGGVLHVVLGAHVTQPHTGTMDLRLEAAPGCAPFVTPYASYSGLLP